MKLERSESQPMADRKFVKFIKLKFERWILDEGHYG